MIDQFFSDPVTLHRLRSGPLGDHIDAFAQVLSAQGYSWLTIREKIRAVAGLSRWLHRRGLGVEALDEQSISGFLRYRRRRGLCRRHTSHTLQELLAHLRDGGIVRNVASVQKSALYDVEKDFAQYLRQERGIIQATAENYLRIARSFLSTCFGKGPLTLDELDPKQVIRFMVRRSEGMNPQSLHLVASGLRSFLRFLYQRGELVRDLAASIPKVANRRLSELPKFLEPENIERLLKACPQEPLWANAITRSCSSWRGSACAPEKWHSWSWTTSTGKEERSASGVKVPGTIGSPSLRMWARLWRGILA